MPVFSRTGPCHASGTIPEIKLTIQSKGVDILTVVGEYHVFLTKSDGVFALGDTVEFLESSLRDALER
jgi:hypothetical protein